MICLQIPVQCEPRLHRDRRADERPGQDRQQIAEDQPDQDIVRAGSQAHKQRADHELRGGNVFPRKCGREVHAALELVLADRLPLELVELI